MHARTHTHTHARTLTHIHTHSLAHTHTHTHARTHTHTFTHTHARTHIHTHTPTSPLSLSHTHTHTHLTSTCSGGIVFGINAVGRRTGEAIAVLETPEQAQLAIQRHRHYLNQRYIEVRTDASISDTADEAVSI